MPVQHLDRLPPRQRPQFVGQVLGARHRRVFDEHRHDADLAAQCRSGLQANEVLRIVEPAATAGVRRAQPPRADDDDQHATRRDGLLDRIDEIDAGVYALDVHEHPLAAEVRRQPVVEPTGVTRRIVAAVADEDAVHRLRVCPLASEICPTFVPSITTVVEPIAIDAVAGHTGRGAVTKECNRHGPAGNDGFASAPACRCASRRRGAAVRRAVAAAELAAGLAAAADDFRGPASSRPETADRLHLTLHFLGSVPRRRLDALRASLCLPFEAFELTLGDCERWSSGLVVTTPRTVPPALSALHAAIGSVLGALQLPTESRPFRPHVTLARRHDGPLPPRITTLLPVWHVRHYVLAESPADSRQPYRLLQTCGACR